MDIQEYLQRISLKYKDSQTSEMGYRTDFENLLETIFTKEQKYHIHHDAKAVGGNKPDFVVLKDKVPILYIENKDIGIDLDKIEKSNQMDRYFGYDNLVLTDQVEFRFYRNGEKYGEPIKVATYDKATREITAISENFNTLEKTIIDFASSHKEPIKHGKHLARIMGGKALRIRDNVREMLASEKDRYSELLNIKKVVTDNLVAGLDDETFADMYAQTLVYGLFAARYNDKTPNSFSRSEARELVPRTNPFLHSFFDHIAGASFPDRLRFIVDELCEVFTHADIEKILHDFYGKEKDNKDPIIHFYEDFLKEYDAKKKMEMGVFYTPRPVVQFIIRTVDEILKKEFGIAKGLADTEKIKVKTKEIYQAQKATKAEQSKDGKLIEVEKEYHRVQILDVATGTGTFLNEVIEYVYKSFAGQEGRWEAYVKENLLPRLHGFELMMASYTIAHLKLGMTLADTGVKNLNQRLGVYLTNTLEEPKDYTSQGTLFGLMDAIAEESKNASRIKSEYPIMCVVGNPPYNVKSTNKGSFIQDLMKDYKKGLGERKTNLDDDYIKFIRFSQNLIEQNGEGVVGMITNNSFIDGITHRQMRKHLLETFDKIYVLDLHGSSKKEETSPDGGKDENIFDIAQGVSIVFLIKNKKEKDGFGKIYHADFFGTRKSKFVNLHENNVNFNEIKVVEPNYFFVPKNSEGLGEYEKGFKVNKIFLKATSGIQTNRDGVVIDSSKSQLIKRISRIADLNVSDLEIEKEFGLKSTREKSISEMRRSLQGMNIENFVTKISYRIFDDREIFYSDILVHRTRMSEMKNYLSRDNIGINVCRQTKTTWRHVMVSDKIVESSFVSNKTSEYGYNSPLYLYTEQNEKIPNLNKEIWDNINEIVGETTPENILDYIYAVLHSPEYREKYKEFLKIDFPRVPYPENKQKFFTLAKIGEQLRGLHLMISKEANEITTTYPEIGNDEVEKLSYKAGRAYINATQYFGNVPEVAWNFYIGGYQPAQKYLKDRKGRKLTNDEIEHYQKIITVLTKTDSLMKEIDKII